MCRLGQKKHHNTNISSLDKSTVPMPMAQDLRMGLGSSCAMIYGAFALPIIMMEMRERERDNAFML
jgi:hypothetical protein